MRATVDWARQTPYSDPGPYAPLLAAVPPDPAVVSAVARNLIVHYRASPYALPPETRADIDLRWVSAILQTDQRRHGGARLDVPRDPLGRVQGCCRDHTLVSVATLRQHGLPARSRVGFAGYFTSGHRHDHVVVEHLVDAAVGTVWVRFDPEIERPSAALPDPLALATGEGAPFETAAEAWRAYRAGRVDPSAYAVEPGSEVGGVWFMHNAVIMEVAHRYGDELLLWDDWGAMAGPGLDPGRDDLSLVDEVAALLVAADAGDDEAERLLLRRYRADARLHPGSHVTRHSPLGGPPIEEPLRG